MAADPRMCRADLAVTSATGSAIERGDEISLGERRMWSWRLPRLWRWRWTIRLERERTYLVTGKSDMTTLRVK